MSGDANVFYPIPISRLAHRYYIYNIDHVTYLRREHNIPGILVGTLPQSPQQNVFLGLPLELLSEEARLLVEKGIGYIVEDAEVHRNGIRNLTGDERRRYNQSLKIQGREFQRVTLEQAVAKKEQILNKLPENKREKLKAAIEKEKEKQRGRLESNPPTPGPDEDDTSESLFSSRTRSSSYSTTSSVVQAEIKPQPITPTLSNPPISIPPPASRESKDITRPAVSLLSTNQNQLSALPQVHSESAYALYKYLHSQSYFLSSGLRFGAQYSVYPGDPLRFHAHFLARGYGWDEEFDLLSLVGGGRLGTGVKKGYLMGGTVPVEARLHQGQETNGQEVEASKAEAALGNVSDGQYDDVRCFCIEWAGM